MGSDPSLKVRWGREVHMSVFALNSLEKSCKDEMDVPDATDVCFNIFASLSSADLTLMSDANLEGQHPRRKQINLEITTLIFALTVFFFGYVGTDVQASSVSNVSGQD